MNIRCRPVSILLFGLFKWSSACTKWVPLDPPYAPSPADYGKLRITNERGVPVVLKEPTLEADSVWGTLATTYCERGRPSHSEEVAVIPTESVHLIEKRGTDAAATIGLLVGITAVFVVIALAKEPFSFDFSEGYR